MEGRINFLTGFLAGVALSKNVSARMVAKCLISGRSNRAKWPARKGSFVGSLVDLKALAQRHSEYCQEWLTVARRSLIAFWALRVADPAGRV